MIRSCFVFILCASTCFGSSTNWYAQRPALSSNYGNIFKVKQIPVDLLPGLILWLPFAADTPATQYCYSVSFSNDLPKMIPMQWTNENGGALIWTGGTQRLEKTITPELQGTNAATWAFKCNLINDGAYGFGRIVSTWPGTGGGMIINIGNTNKIRFLAFDSSANQRTLETGANIFPTGRIAIIAITLTDRTNVSFYVDGTNILNGTVAAWNPAADGSKYTVGNSPSFTARPINGRLYSLWQWRRALSSNDIWRLNGAER